MLYEKQIRLSFQGTEMMKVLVAAMSLPVEESSALIAGVHERSKAENTPLRRGQETDHDYRRPD